MQPHVEQRIRDQRAEDLRRLADQGAAKGVRVMVDPKTGEHVATSATDPTVCYHVSAAGGCTCKGWTYWHRCQHHSLLLAELGLIPDAGAVPCPVCQGRGWGEPYRLEGTDAYLVGCRACDGRGAVPSVAIVVAGEGRPAALLNAA